MMPHVHYLQDSGPSPMRLAAADEAAVLGDATVMAAASGLQAQGLERFLARTAILPDGRVAFACSGKLPQGRVRCPVLVWGSVFGGCLRIVLPFAPHWVQAVFVPEDAEFEAFAASRSCVLVAIRAGRPKEAFALSFAEPGQAHALDALIEDTRQIDDSLRRSEPAWGYDRKLLLVNSVSTVFRSFFTRGDWLQLGWCESARDRIRAATKVVAYWVKEAETEIIREHIERFPHHLACVEAARDCQNDASRLAAVHAYLNANYNSLRIGAEFRGWAQSFLPSQAPEMVVDFVTSTFLLWQSLPWHPAASGCGKWRQSVGDWETFVIDVDRMDLDKDEDARAYWPWLPDDVAVLSEARLDRWDRPEDPRALAEGWVGRTPDVDPEAARQAAEDLLAEAQALRRWTIPQRALVRLSVGPFVSVEVTESPIDVVFVWRTAKGRYAVTTVGVDNAQFSRGILEPDVTRQVSSVTWTMNVLRAATIRDFWVSEERHRVFDATVERGPRGPDGKRDPARRRVVYLPRIHYTAAGPDFGRLEGGLAHRARSQHLVRPFFRRAERPSALQLEIAKREGRSVPDGHTFVRSHYRGKAAAEVETVYRSRSAVELLYGDLAPVRLPDGPIADDWFAFEAATAELLTREMGLVVLYRAPRGGGDLGVDILAARMARSETAELWVVQCKFYGDRNPVGPAVMRELLGAMQDTAREPGQTVRGMVVTTARITRVAAALGARHGIEMVDGERLERIRRGVGRLSQFGKVGSTLQHPRCGLRTADR